MSKLWTIQKKEVLVEVAKKGYYAPMAKHTMAYKYGEGFKNGYNLIAEELYKKDQNKKRNKYPIWATLTRVKPSDFGVKELGYVEIELEIPDNRLLLSDFERFHCILNNFYCPLDDEDQEAFIEKYFGTSGSYKLLPCYSKEEYNKAVRDSWKNVFDVSKTEVEDIQVCFWVMYSDDIVSWRNIKENEFLKEEKYE